MTPGAFFILTEDDRQRLLRLARRSLEAHVRGEPAEKPDRGGALDLPFGAFVTIYRSAELRGCLGRVEPDASLGDAVSHLARAVSDSDPRFAAVRLDELPDITIEISVLTPEHELADIDDLEVGRHGLIVEHGRRRGLLLPQVPVEHEWDREAFLEHACLKAGLDRHAWKSGVRLYVFEAEVFREGPQSTTEPRGR